MTPQDLKNLFEESTGNIWNDESGIPWLNKNRESLGNYIKKPILHATSHITLSDKANWLSQRHCHLCESDSPISTIPIQIAPESWQSLNSIDKRAFKEAIRTRLFDKSQHKPLNGRICLSFLFVCKKSRKIRDIDNMAKLFMDSIKGVLMGDDREVDHLNLMRLAHDGDEEYLTVKISTSSINLHKDVVLAKFLHSWADPRPLRIEDFRKTK
jgi:Holliday junction resolvase RusA-like endonuclease